MKSLEKRCGILVFWLTAGLSVVLLSSIAAAADGHAVGSGVLLKDFLYRCLNFAVMGGILFYFLAKPLRKALAERRANFVETLQQACKTRKSAEEKVRDFEVKLADSEREMAEMLLRAQEADRREREALLEETRELAEIIAKEARQIASREMARARRELRQEAAQMAVAIAEKRLRENFTPEDGIQLVRQNLQSMESQQ